MLKLGSLVLYTVYHSGKREERVGIVVEFDSKRGYAQVLEPNGKTFSTVRECLEVLG